jgi:ribose/xylose/arabinose/galactoside ABC-type transport system permease subunit
MLNIIKRNFSTSFTIFIFAGVIITLAFISPSFFDFYNILSVLGQATFVAIPAVGLSMIMISGNFNLSFVGVIGVSAVTVGVLMSRGVPLFIALLVGLAICLAVDLSNAFLIIKMKIHPWLCTLATMLAMLGLETAISGGYFISARSSLFMDLRFGSFLGFPFAVWILALVFLVFYYVMHKRPLGFHIYAVGTNPEAARKAGIKVDLVKFIPWIFMAILSWVTSFMYLIQLSGYPPEAANISLLTVILAVFFGMAISTKNVINVPGTVLGAVFVALMGNGLSLAGVSSYWIKLVEGVILIAVIMSNSLGSDELVQL